MPSAILRGGGADGQIIPIADPPPPAVDRQVHQIQYSERSGSRLSPKPCLTHTYLRTDEVAPSGARVYRWSCLPGGRSV